MRPSSTSRAIPATTRPRPWAHVALGAAVALAALASASPLAAQDGSPLSWLAGCWEQRGARSVVQERWTSPAGSQLLGVSRTLRRVAERDTMVEFEFLRVFARGGTLVYAAQPGGRPPTEFVADSAGPDRVTFANPAHDFPQRIIYRRVGTDSIVARIEGTVNGAARGMDFRYARVACAERAGGGS